MDKAATFKDCIWFWLPQFCSSSELTALGIQRKMTRCCHRRNAWMDIPALAFVWLKSVRCSHFWSEAAGGRPPSLSLSLCNLKFQMQKELFFQKSEFWCKYLKPLCGIGHNSTLSLFFLKSSCMCRSEEEGYGTS